MEAITKHFTNLSVVQLKQFQEMKELYSYWNERINLISRKDFDSFYLHHVLHSLSICKIISFSDNTKIIDVGTGGGFPGIPLAIMFPDCDFVLVDSIKKKTNAVKQIAADLGLKNVEVITGRVEELDIKSHFVVSRAVTQLPVFVKWIKGKIVGDNFNKLKNGILYLKGGDFEDEMKKIKNKVVQYPISDFFAEPYFETKKIVYIKA